MGKFIDFSAYNTDQVFLTSGRVVINAREDNVFIVSKKDVAVSAGGDMHINIGPKGSKTGSFIINSSRVQFGLPTRTTSMEPVAKGTSSVESITQILTELRAFMEVASTAKDPVAVALSTSLNLAGNAFLSKIPGIQDKVNKIESTITFTN